jgi:F420-non-reducing hydrogenase large subunit
MQTITIEPLRWQEELSRISVCLNAGHPSVYYQVVSPRIVETICIGRPVEEVPRIVSMPAPAHHLAAALALDQYFQAEPPPSAQKMRAALLQAHYCSAHLRKLYFLMTSRLNPFDDFRTTTHKGSQTARHLLEATARHIALAREAEDILGGRHDHPLTPVAGGVSRYPGESHCARLQQICNGLLPFAGRMAQFIRADILAGEGMLSRWSDRSIPALAGLHLSDGNQLTLTHPDGAAQHFEADRMGDLIALRQVAWTHQPFAFIKEKGWRGIDDTQSLFHVGPLARFNAAQPAATPLAEQERRRMIECIGAPPVYKLTAAFAALAVELVQAVETLQSLSQWENFSAAPLRTIPAGRRGVARAALETPQGAVWHHYEVDAADIVRSVTLIDSCAANNALKSLWAAQIIGAALGRNERPDVMKQDVALGLLPF